MALYFALPFGVFALAILIRQEKKEGIVSHSVGVLRRIIVLLVIFVLSNAILWGPWFVSKTANLDTGVENYKFSVDGTLDILNRVFPIRRGIFEDKVASFWCVLHYSSLYKVNTLLERPTQVLLTTGTTLIFCVPSLLLLFKAPTKSQFIRSMICISTSFFLFSFQVHEKQLLSPLMLIWLIPGDFAPLLTASTTMANFSMLKLYRDDFN